MIKGGKRLSMRGIPASGGVAVGRALVLDRRGGPIKRRYVPDADVRAEVNRLRMAIESSRREIETVRESLAEEHLRDYGLILDAHMMMHRDELVVDAAIQTIEEAHINAEWALRRTLDTLESRLEKAGSAYFRERTQDIEHVGQHILRHLSGSSDDLPVIRDDAVIVADDLSPADAARLLSVPVRGLVVALGTATSHTAILTRTLEIPAVVGVADVLVRIDTGDLLVVDGLHGEVIVHPTAEETDRAEARGERYRSFTGRLREQRDRSSTTSDGEAVTFLANVELPVEAQLATAAGAQGIGLYRTEFLYLDRATPPSEEEQLKIYGQVVREMGSRPVVFRTCDIGGDKLPLGAKRIRRPANPALGLRAIRLSLARPDLFRAQVRALLRVATEGDVQIMLPLISTLSEVRAARKLIDKCQAELLDAGLAHRRVPVGIMIEVPSAALMAEALAEEADFFSVGTNDLVQYTLALDRTNPEVASLGSVFDPSVLRLLDVTAKAAHARSLPLSMCGDMAADPVALPLVLGLGFRRLSVPLGFLPLARETIRRLDSGDARAVAAAALRLGEAREVHRLVLDHFGPILGDLWEEQGIELDHRSLFPG